MTVGNITALRQDRMVRLLAWSSIAQAGYILAPLGALALARGRSDAAIDVAVAATLAYTVFYVVLEMGAFGAVIAVRGADDGGPISDYRGVARRRPWIGAAFVLAFLGLAGLPPGIAGLFAKVIVVRSLLTGGSAWLAIIVALNAVIGLAYYARVIGVDVRLAVDIDDGAGTSRQGVVDRRCYARDRDLGRTRDRPRTAASATRRRHGGAALVAEVAAASAATSR